MIRIDYSLYRGREIKSTKEKRTQEPPILIGWEEDWGGKGKTPKCPVCEELLDETERCPACGQAFIQEDPVLQEYLKPAPEERYDCFLCDGVQTVVGRRAKCNGHFHGKCEKCGAVYME